MDGTNLCLAPMGGHKTSWAMSYMNSHSDKWIYAAPLLSESRRIVEGCPRRGFVEPMVIPKSPFHKKMSKREHLLSLIEGGLNISTTHAMLTGFDSTILEAIKSENYHLMLDETPEFVEPFNMSMDRLKEMVDGEYLAVDDVATGQPAGSQPTVQRLRALSKARHFRATSPSKAKQDGTGAWHWTKRMRAYLLKLFRLADAGQLYLVDGQHVVRVLPPEMLTAFESSSILTFMPEGSYLSSWMAANGIEPHHRTVTMSGGKALLDVWAGPNADEGFRSTVGGLIQVYEGTGPKSLNWIGEPTAKSKNPLTTNWWEKELTHEKAKALHTLCGSFFKRHRQPGTTAEHNMWTVLGSVRELVAGDGSSCENWVASTTRATNLYIHKANIAFMANPYPLVPVDAYFKGLGKPIDTDKFSLSVLLQWAWRSRLREGKPVSAYIPSSRMRELFSRWATVTKPEPAAVPFKSAA